MRMLVENYLNQLLPLLFPLFLGKLPKEKPKREPSKVPMIESDNLQDSKIMAIRIIATIEKCTHSPVLSCPYFFSIQCFNIADSSLMAKTTLSSSFGGSLFCNGLFCKSSLIRNKIKNFGKDIQNTFSYLNSALMLNSNTDKLNKIPNK